MEEPERDIGGRGEDERRVRSLKVDQPAALARREHLSAVRRVRVDRPAGQHERRLDLRRRPGRVPLEQQRRAAGDMRRRHARSAEAVPAARNGRVDVDAGRADVRFETEVDSARACR